MNKLLLIPILLFFVATVSAQQDLLVFKKRNKTVAYFRKDTYITFQLKNKQWFTGYISKVQNDSFYMSPLLIHYLMGGNDTIRYPMKGVALTDVYAMPRKGEQTSFVNDKVSITLGHEHWVWLKNGLILKLFAGGSILLNLANGLIKNEPVYSTTKLGVAAGIFLIGEILHQTYSPTLRIGKKYRLESIAIAK